MASADLHELAPHLRFNADVAEIVQYPPSEGSGGKNNTRDPHPPMRLSLSKTAFGTDV